MTSPAIPSDPAIEHVLVVPTLLFHEVGYFQGYQPSSEKYLSILLDEAHTSYRPRNEVEQDPSYKQLIPYCLFVYNGSVFYYRRGKAGGEGRLHSKRSVGIGGHISSTDQAARERRYFAAIEREIAEEIDVQCGYTQRCVGLINDDLTEVGRVHLGIVHIFELEAPKVLPREQSILETGFALPADLLTQIDEFETWSQICLKSLFS